MLRQKLVVIVLASSHFQYLDRLIDYALFDYNCWLGLRLLSDTVFDFLDFLVNGLFPIRLVGLFDLDRLSHCLLLFAGELLLNDCT